MEEERVDLTTSFVYEVIFLEFQRKYFALATDFFFKRGRSKYLQNRVLTGGTVFSLILIAGSTTAITVKRQEKKGYLTRGTYVDISKLY